MNLYLDTSALVKLYVEEEGSIRVRQMVDAATLVASSALALVEGVAALTSRRKAGDLDPSDYRRVMRYFRTDWARYLHIAVNDRLIQEAARTAEAFQLRAYDAVHLASALTLRDRLDAGVTFLCWDAELTHAAERAGLGAI